MPVIESPPELLRPPPDYYGGMWKSLKRWPTLLALLVPVIALTVEVVCLPTEVGSRARTPSASIRA
jgi:hypothetical protein